MEKQRIELVILAVIAVLTVTLDATELNFSVTESSQYLIISRKAINLDPSIDIDNYELGANKAPVPSTDNFLDGGSSGGPALAGNVPDFPTGIRPVFQGIGWGGNLALMDADGAINLSDVGVYADPSVGIRVAGDKADNVVSSNSFFNDPKMFPNTFDTGTQTGSSVNPGDADQSTRIETTYSGVTDFYDFTGLNNELSLARTAINGLGQTDVLDVSGSAGQISNNNNYVFSVGSGLNVIDIITGDNDFLIENSNFVIDGPSDALVIFRLPGNDNMLISQANILVGEDMGDSSVMFYTDQEENDTHFNFDNTVLSGVAFWSLAFPEGGTGSSIDINNAQGCTQLIAHSIDLDDVRFNRCAFTPEPATIALLGLGILAIRRKRR